MIHGERKGTTNGFISIAIRNIPCDGEFDWKFIEVVPGCSKTEIYSEIRTSIIMNSAYKYVTYSNDCIAQIDT